MKISVNKIVKIGVLSALSIIIMIFEFPLPFMPPFLKIDFSEIPALLAAFAFGPLSAVMVELVKNLLHLLKTDTSGIGELANFVVGGAFVFTVGLIYRFFKSRKGAIVSLLIGTAVMVVCASIFNYFVLLPLYASVLHFPTVAVVGMGTDANHSIVDVKTFIVYAIAPFNLFKGLAVSLVVAVIYKRLSPILHK